MDGHVHLHRLDLVEDVLEASAGSFEQFGSRRTGLLGALLLTQASWECVFESLASKRSAGAWSILPVAEEPQSLIATLGDRSIALVCGRQVRVDNGIEVSALGTTQRFEDGQPLAHTVEAIARSGALTMIPWGLGKWVGNRGRMVEKTMRANAAKVFFMGDSGCRLAGVPAPRLIRAARAEHIGVLAGTDPFPFWGDHRRTGSFGFFAALEPSAAAPWSILRAWLESRTQPLELYGSPTGPLRFLVNQFGIHLYNRKRRRAAQ